MLTLVVSVVYCLQVDGGLGCGADFGCVCCCGFSSCSALVCEGCVC